MLPVGRQSVGSSASTSCAHHQQAHRAHSLSRGARAALLHERAQRRGSPLLALGGTAADAVSQATLGLMQAASDGALGHHAGSVSGFMHSLTHVLDSGNIYHAASHLSPIADAASDAMHHQASAAAHLTASLPTDALALDPELLSAAQQGWSELAASTGGAWADLAAAATPLLGAPHAAGLQALAVLASERLAALASVDAVAHASLQTSMDSLLGGLDSLLREEAGTHALAWTHALVLGVQQLVLATRGAEGAAPGGAYSIQAMVEAQAAVQAAAKAAPVSLQGLVALIMGVMSVIIACIPRGDAVDLTHASATEDQVPLRYNPAALSEYWSKRPVVVMRRSAEVVSRLVGFLVEIMADAQLGRWESNMPARAAQLRETVESLGATCVKIAQAASTRVDMLPQCYLDEFARLQDNVQTFSTVEARYVLEEGLGRPVDTIFEWMSEEPLAAASLGQVYRGKLRPECGGTEVAVKVQRPGVLESAALDVFIMRRGAVLFSKLPGMSDQWACVLDDWALRFFQEMDYQLEAHNTMTFKKQMASLQGIVVPTVHPDLTSRKVIVTDWIDGEKLGDSKATDVRALCSTLLNCYLIQLLETGLLHADPHPGNLMRTSDGKLVILDFGLMTEVTEAQRIGLVEFIAHLTMEDWDSLTQDLVTLGFMPEDMPEEAKRHIKPVMHQVFSKIVSGGGLGKAGLNFTSLGIQLSHISMSYQLCIPGYFTNVLRAFSVIEGTALKVDPNYAIVNECMPYLSRRLLTDNNPRMRAALRQLLYGDGTRLDVARLQRLIASFSSFTTAAQPSAAGGSAASGPTFSRAYDERVKGARSGAYAYQRLDDGPVLNETMREALKVVFAKDGSYAQELIVEELVAATDAMSREAMSEALRLVMGSASAVTALRSVEALGPLRAMLLPIPLPMEMLYSMEPAVALTKEDRQALDTLRAVLDLLQPSLMSGIPSVAYAGSRAVRAAGEVVPMLPELLPGMQVTVELFLRQLVRRMALRLAEDLEPGKSATAATSGGSSSGGGASSSSSSSTAAAAVAAADRSRASSSWGPAKRPAY